MSETGLNYQEKSIYMSDNTRTYELGYLLVPTVPETGVEAAVQELNTAITNAGGTIVNAGNPEFIDLAYTMEKSVASKKNRYSQGYFGWVKFDAAPETMEALKKVLDANANVIRYLLIKTSAQNLVIFRKPKIEAVRETAVDEVELLDESIDEELKEDHEKLPDLEGDILEEAAVQAPLEGEEKEE
jgi:ribosomal protein S6